MIWLITQIGIIITVYVNRRIDATNIAVKTALCPKECICLSPAQVMCNSGSLDEIPLKLIPPTTEQLSLTKNRLSIIKGDAFSGLKNLRSITLDYNNVTLIKPFAFRGLPRIEKISIQHTPLTTVPPFAFAALQNVNSIHLCFNQISHVEGYAFAGTTNLQLLVLTNNPLVQLESHAFSGLSTVNRILFPPGVREIEEDAFYGLDTVNVLRLAFLDLENGLHSGCLRGLTKVQTLSIQESDLGTIDAAAFQGATKVHQLEILSNKIDSIDCIYINDSQEINHMRWQGNHILEVPTCVNLQVKQLTVMGNHFPCDCKLPRLAESHFANKSSYFLQNNFCISPLEVNGRPMSDVDLEALGRCSHISDDYDADEVLDEELPGVGHWQPTSYSLGSRGHTTYYSSVWKASLQLIAILMVF